MTDPYPQHFAGSKAAAYDKTRAPLASIYGALHLCTNAVIGSLSDEASVLCAGVGTGDELIVLARLHPAWTFSARRVGRDAQARAFGVYSSRNTLGARFTQGRSWRRPDSRESQGHSGFDI